MIVRALPKVWKFIESLPLSLRAAVKAELKDLEEHGLDAPLVSLRQIRERLWEIRTHDVRVFYFMHGETMILLHAYTKQSRKAPKHEIETAYRRMKALLQNEET